MVLITRTNDRGGGRGVVATRDVAVGECLLVEKAVACGVPSSKKGILSVDLHTGLRYSAAQDQLISTVIAKLLNDPSLLDVLESLSAGRDMTAPLDPTESS